MPDVNLGALTIPVFTAIFGAGWTACYTFIVRPMEARLTKLEAKQDSIEEERNRELAELRRKVLT